MPIWVWMYWVSESFSILLTRQYYALKDEVKEVEQIRRNVYSILMEENGREHPTRKHEHER